MTTFDLWLTTQPAGTDAPEPSQRYLEDARDALQGRSSAASAGCAGAAQLSDDGGDMPTDDQVYALACMLACDEARAADDEADEHAQESWRDDMEDRYGDGP